MSKHTPGPWWLGRDPSHFGSLTSITGGSDSTGGIRSVAEVGGLDIDEAEANARLIAAAPDLLAIGKRLVSDVCKPGEDMVELQVSRADYEAFKAAIAKAGG